MTEPLKRDDVIELLRRLGSDQDEAVLEAAREVHARVTLAGVAWEDLLVPDMDASGGADVEYRDPEEESPEPPAETAMKDGDALALIDELLAKTDISADLREELENYKNDIAEDEFEEADRRYLRALRERLSKRR